MAGQAAQVPAARRADPRRRRRGQGRDPPDLAGIDGERAGDARQLVGVRRTARALRPDPGRVPGTSRRVIVTRRSRPGDDCALRRRLFVSTSVVTGEPGGLRRLLVAGWQGTRLFRPILVLTVLLFIGLATTQSGFLT